MASATMTFASAQFSPGAPDELAVSFDQPNRFLIRGVARGPGSSNWRLDQTTKRVGVSASFYLTPDRMPDEGAIFVSAPAVRFDVGAGDMAALTGLPAWCFIPFIVVCDNPSAVCTLSLMQTIFVSGEPSGGTSKQVDLFSIRDDAAEADGPKSMPPAILYEPLQFELDRNSTLGILLVATFDMYLEGGSYVYFGATGPFPRPVTGRFPEWPINSID